MDNSLLAVRDINHKYIVVGGRNELQRIKSSDRIESEEIRRLVQHSIADKPKLGTRNK